LKYLLIFYYIIVTLSVAVEAKKKRSTEKYSAEQDTPSTEFSAGPFQFNSNGVRYGRYEGDAKKHTNEKNLYSNIQTTKGQL
jgi:guanyl-specific ribonuclease Sa